MRLVKINTILKILLIIFGLYLTLSTISLTIDGDFGWHLRFGQDAILGNFQYADSYTWSYFGKNWVNHEWGGDMIFYLLYSHFGYFSLVAFISLAVWLSFLLIPKAYGKKITIHSIIISIITLLAADFIITMRLAMLALPFFVLTLYILENIDRKKYIYFLPGIIWLWSFMHGSWILAFVVINIYLFANIIGRILTWKKIWKLDNLWSDLTMKKVVLWQIISAIVVMINPYTYQMWHEIILYFSNSYFKQHISEWLPSYTYPIFIAPWIIACFCAVLLFMAFKYKKADFVHILLFIFFADAAMQYKRNNLFLVLICTPILVYAVDYIFDEIKWSKRKKQIIGYTLLVLIIGSIILIKKPIVRYTTDVFADQALTEYFGFPTRATKFLQKEIGNKKDLLIFNEYAWGGFLIWQMQNQRVFLDGRSAATWKDESGKLMLRKQIDLMTQQDGLQFIEKNNVKYILLRNNYTGYRSPNWINSQLFTEDKLKVITGNEAYQLVKDIKASKRWIQIYHDEISTIWKLSVTKS